MTRDERGGRRLWDGDYLGSRWSRSEGLQTEVWGDGQAQQPASSGEAESH